MPLVPIDSVDDPRLAAYRSLKRTNATRWADSFVVEGDKLVWRLLASRFPTVSILADPRLAESFAALAPGQTPIYVLPRREIESVVGFNFHRGALACGRRVTLSAVESLPQPPAPLALVACPHVDDPENLGAIFRNSLALGAHAVVLGPSCADPLSRRVLRVSMGASLALPWEVVDDWATWFLALRHKKIETVAAVLDPTAQTLATAARPSRLALLLGSEAHGLADDLVVRCDRRVTIPMAGGADSLNVAAAAGILLHHFCPPRREPN